MDLVSGTWFFCTCIELKLHLSSPVFCMARIGSRECRVPLYRYLQRYELVIDGYLPRYRQMETLESIEGIQGIQGVPAVSHGTVVLNLDLKSSQVKSSVLSFVKLI